jgi:hypothetical protein
MNVYVTDHFKPYVGHILVNFLRPPIYRVPRFTGPFPFPPRGPVNRGFTVYDNSTERLI